MKHWPGFPQQKAKKQKNQLFQRTPLIPRNHEFWFLLTHLPTLHQFLLFYKMSYVLHQMSDITTTKQQVIKKKQSWVLAQFCKSKRYQIQKKKNHETTKISISPPHFFFSDRPPNQSRPHNNIIKIVAFVWKNPDFKFTKIRILKKKSL